LKFLWEGRVSEDKKKDDDEAIRDIRQSLLVV